MESREQYMQSFKPIIPPSVVSQNEMQPRQIKKARRKIPQETAILTHSSENFNQNNQTRFQGLENGHNGLHEEVIILRVKRPKHADDLEEIYLDYDATSGAIKRTKMVTEQDAIQNALSMFKISNDGENQNQLKDSLLVKSIMNGGSQKDDGINSHDQLCFSLGINGQQKVPTKQVRLQRIQIKRESSEVVEEAKLTEDSTKRSLMTSEANNAHSKTESLVKQLCLNKMKETREKYRHERLSQMRNKISKEALAQLDQNYEDSKIEKNANSENLISGEQNQTQKVQAGNNEQIDASKNEKFDYKNPTIDGLQVIDLAKIIEDQQNEENSNSEITNLGDLVTGQNKDIEYKTEYFLVQKYGNDYYDPINDKNWQKHQFDRDYMMENGDDALNEDHDSENSNREDHDQNEYPDEDEVADNYIDSYGSEEGGGSRRRKSSNSAGWSDDSDQDDQKNNGNKYMSSKQQNIQLKNSIMDKIFKKNKDWSYQNQQACQKETGFLDDYENDGGKTYGKYNEQPLCDNDNSDLDMD